MNIIKSIRISLENPYNRANGSNCRNMEEIGMQENESVSLVNKRRNLALPKHFDKIIVKSARICVNFCL